MEERTTPETPEQYLKRTFHDPLYIGWHLEDVITAMSEYAELARKEEQEKSRIELAYSQFVGFNHGKWNGSDIIGLIESMGLNKGEWSVLKSEYSLSSLSDSEIEEIDNYFKI